MLVALLCAPRFFAAEPVRILVAYHSQTGNTETLARAVGEGVASVAGVELTLRKVADATSTEIAKADGLIIGTPVHWHNLSADTKRFLDRVAESLAPGKTWGEGRTAGSFCTVGGGSGGQEMARMSILSALLAMRFVVIGGVTGEGYGSLGPVATTGMTPPGVSTAARAEARQFGERFARLTRQFRAR